MTTPETRFFIRKRADAQRLIAFGFAKIANGYRYSTEVMEGQFRLEVAVSENNRVATRLLEADSGEEYLLWRVPEAVGAFVGKVRAACDACLADIAAQCFSPNVFQSAGAQFVLRLARETYGDTPEFLWPKFPTNAVLRRKDSGKWYAALLIVPANKLGLPFDTPIEILDLRATPNALPALIDNVRIFPGYHMNKQHWITALLDGSVPDADLVRLLAASHALA